MKDAECYVLKKISGRRVMVGTRTSASQNTGDFIKTAAIPAILAARDNFGHILLKLIIQTIKFITKN